MDAAVPSQPLVVSQGDPAGIGPEITLKAWSALRSGGPPFAVIGGPDLYRRTGERLGLSVPVRIIERLADAPAVFAEALPVLPTHAPLPDPVHPGHSDPAHGASVIEAIERGVAACRRGAASAIVTIPITKAALYDTGFDFPGHTEFLAHLAVAGTEHAPPLPVMMLASPMLRVVPLTIHVPLSAVPPLVTAERIRETATVMARALHLDFGIADPRIAVAGLNPHAGEAGRLGTEDMDRIAPAVAALRAEGIRATGPHPADTLFHAPARASYDAALCMYHDQALIPIKALDFDRGVNVTLGLPFVRTSPDHGTAYDIAGQGVARADNLIEALHMAAALGARRAAAASLGP
ncbi:MAG: 4-hydroxythreonine-4-phosphate dehydrogenase PdxA [Alphaproteobacteria bacterium]